MATFTAFVFTIFLTLKIAKAQIQINVTRGSSLTPTGSTTSWLSPSGLFSFGFYPQTSGYALGVYITGIPEITVVWTASRHTLPISNNATLSFTTDGRLIVDQTPGQPIDITGTTGASRASMLDSGNFVLYGSNGTMWQSFDHPTDTLLSGQRLVANQTLFSSVSETDQSIGVFKLILQGDGNLVQHPNVGTGDTPLTSYWDSQTVGSGPNVTLNLDPDGHLYLLQNSSIYIKNLTEPRRGDRRERVIYRMKIDVDGIFRVYRRDLSNMNESITYESSPNKCAARGLCGVNGYCEVFNDAARCRCLPGFESVNPALRSSGCRRNYTSESCKIVNDGRNSLFQMTRLDNIEWEDVPYAALETSTLEECSSACLNDSICEVARYGGRNCKFQRLPLKYMQVAGSDYSDVAWIKVCESSFVNGQDPTNPSIQVKKVRRVEIFVIGVSLISFSVLVLLISGTVMCRAKVWAYRNISDHVNIQLFDNIGPRAFSYGELEGITDGFREELGRGSFGIVYKGVIDCSNKAIAVKKLKEELAQEGEREFQTEMKVIGRTHHRNLVRLLGYCCEGPERLLVMEYMNKSLADMLFDKESKPSWEERIRMAADIACGIQYLHEECETVIIHCDIKPQNILMDEYGRAKISDFGLAKLLERDQTKTFTFIRGTRGYVAPEWHKKLPVTVKVDVYSFGIVLLEILCCRRHVENECTNVNEAILEEWVYECYEKDELWKVVMNDDVDKREMEDMVRIGLWCIQEEPSQRPSMKKVLLMLQGILEIPLPPNPSSFTSVV